MITLYQYELSPFCTKVALILNVKGVPYRIEEVPLSRSQTVKRFSPTSKLPTIEHDGRFIDDSTEIAYYLEAQFPKPALIPGDAKLKAKCHLYEDWADESLNFYMMKLRWLPQNRARWARELVKYDNAFWRFVISRLVAKRTLDILDKQGVGRKSEQAALKDLGRHMQAIAADLQGSDYLLGDSLSLADISVFVQLKWLYENREGKAVIDQYPGINEWRSRVESRTGDAMLVSAR